MKLSNLQEKATRDSFIDILRFIGLSLIILAHVDSPLWIMQLRWFDVPLMVIVSGMAYNLSEKRKTGYFTYVFLRIKRLVFPVWIFLTLFFLLLSISGIDKENKLLNFNVIINSYLLISGIGFVWIVRVFFLVSLLPPKFINFINKLNNFSFVLYSILFLVINELVIMSGIGIYSRLINDVILYIIPYAILFLIGNRASTFSYKSQLSIFTACLFVCIIYFIYLYIFCDSTFSDINDKYKYPPRLLYFFYGILGFSILMLYKTPLIAILFKIDLFNNMILFISKNSLWIYLWHIIPILFFNKFGNGFNWILQYLITYFVSIIFVSVQLKIVNFFYLKIIKLNKILS